MTKTITNTVRGIEMKFAGHTRSLELCARMNYETENLDFIDRMKPGEVMYDLGACEGRFAIYAALKGVTCYAFEPEKNNFGVFLENIALNGLQPGKVNANKLAVGDAEKQAVLKIGQPWAGGHQKVVEQGDSRADLRFNFVEEEVIEVVSLDQFIAANNLPKPHYLKVDIDGSELSFVNGAKKTLADPHLKGVIFELELTDKNFPVIMETLAGCGFKEESRHQVPNEPNLYNIIFTR